jgi:hypothetical protein
MVVAHHREDVRGYNRKEAHAFRFVRIMQRFYRTLICISKIYEQRKRNNRTERKVKKSKEKNINEQ